MAKWSTGLRNFINNYGSFKRAFTGGKLIVYQGTIPTSADDAIVGTTLVTLTLAAGAYTAETLARGTVTITVDGTVTGITVNSIQVMSGTVDAQGTTTATAAAVAANINAFQPVGNMRVRAWNSANVVILEALPNTGVVTWAVVSAGTATRTDANFGSGGAARAGIASSNGLKFGASSSGVMATSGSWLGTIANSGTAQFFCLYGPSIDDTAAADASPYNCIRIVGSCGTSGADYNMAATALIAGRQHSMDTGDVTLSETAAS